MYVQITTRCNMTCAHCCFDCGPDGEDMSMQDFASATRLAKECDLVLTLGGGEPTLHPKFWDMVDFSRAVMGPQSHGVITNGSITSSALRLAHLTEEKQISAELSYDSYHSQINPRVVEAFSRIGKIKTVEPDDILPFGRGRNLSEMPVGSDVAPICGGLGLHVVPDGTLYQCGCCDESLGHVSTITAEKIQEYLETVVYDCSRLRNFKQQRLERMLADHRRRRAV